MCWGGAGQHGGLGASRQGGDAGQQLADVEWLGQVVVSAGGETGKHVTDLPEGGQEQHRRRYPAGPDCLTDVTPVGVGQTDVEDDHVKGAVSAVDAGKGRASSMECPLSPRSRTAHKDASSSTTSTRVAFTG